MTYFGSKLRQAMADSEKDPAKKQELQNQADAQRIRAAEEQQNAQNAAWRVFGPHVLAEHGTNYTPEQLAQQQGIGADRYKQLQDWASTTPDKDKSGSGGDGGDKLSSAADKQIQAAGMQMQAAQALQTKVSTGGGGGGSGFAEGGPIRGPGGSREDLAGLFALSNGEFVMQTAAVQKYGIDLFHALNSMSVGNFAEGGGVGSNRVSIPTPTTSNSKPSSILNLSIDGNQFRGLVAPNDVARQLKSYAVSRQSASTGDKPSWVQ